MVDNTPRPLGEALRPVLETLDTALEEVRAARVTLGVKLAELGDVDLNGDPEAARAALNQVHTACTPLAHALGAIGPMGGSGAVAAVYAFPSVAAGELATIENRERKRAEDEIRTRREQQRHQRYLDWQASQSEEAALRAAGDPEALARWEAEQAAGSMTRG